MITQRLALFAAASLLALTGGLALATPPARPTAPAGTSAYGRTPTSTASEPTGPGATAGGRAGSPTPTPRGPTTDCRDRASRTTSRSTRTPGRAAPWRAVSVPAMRSATTPWRTTAATRTPGPRAADRPPTRAVRPRCEAVGGPPAARTPRVLNVGKRARGMYGGICRGMGGHARGVRPGCEPPPDPPSPRPPRWNLSSRTTSGWRRPSTSRSAAGCRWPSCCPWRPDTCWPAGSRCRGPR